MERMATAMQANVAEVTDAFATQKVVFKSQLRAWVSVTFGNPVAVNVARHNDAT
jgi:hypothetical protein